MKLTRAIRITAPLALISVGISLLSGCLFIPTFNRTLEGTDASAKVGDAKSRKPLRVGSATRDDVIRLLGAPQHISEDGSVVAYTWKVLNGVWVWPLCFTAENEEGARALILRFDQANMLRGFSISSRDGNIVYPNHVGRAPLPDELRSARTMPAENTGGALRPPGERQE